MNEALDFATIVASARGRFGIFDGPCPRCGPDRREPRNRVREVLRVWRPEADFLTFNCARCGVKGYRLGDDAVGLRSSSFQSIASPVATGGAARQASKAAWLWKARNSAARTPVERYLRQIRVFGGRLPPTIAFLRPRTTHQYPAMIAVFGLAAEVEPGELVPPTAVSGIHLTLLRSDGLGKAGTDRDKFMVGPSAGLPIVLSPINDGLGLIVCEGIETGLSLAEATGCGVWAAGAAGRMPALADSVPAWMDVVTIAAEADDAGRKGAEGLADRLDARGIYSETKLLTGRAMPA